MVAMAKSPDNKHIWTVGLDHSLKAWSVETGKVLISSDLLKEDQDHDDRKKHGQFLMNPEVKVYPPSPGIVVYRFEESFLYPNSSLVNDAVVDYVKENTKRGQDMTGVSASARPWNDPGKNSDSEAEANESKPLLHAIVLDFSAMYGTFGLLVHTVLMANTQIAYRHHRDSGPD